MTTMIRKGRALVAASLLTAVIMSVSISTTSDAMVQPTARPMVKHDLLRPSTTADTTRICPIDWRRSTWHVKQLIRCVAAYHGVSQEKALYIAYRESRYRPSAYNGAGPAGGIYQHLLRYWPERAADFGFRDWSVFNARANIFVTMRMVRRYGWTPWGG